MAVIIPTTRFQRRMITISMLVASIMILMDATIANVVLPVMQGNLKASTDQLPWVITSYIVASAVATPLAGTLTNRIGRKKILLGSLIGFSISSLLCGIASDITQMVVFRALQGFTSAPLVPLAQSVLFDIYEREEHPQAMAMYSMGVIIGPIIGPVIGGYISEFSNWRWVFFINLPISAIAFAGLMSFLPEKPKERLAPFDYYGFVLLAVAIMATQLMLDRGESKDWFSSTEIVVEVFLLIGATYFYALHTTTARTPFLDKRLFIDANFMSAMFLMFILSGTLFAFIVLLAPYLQDMIGYSIIDAGWILAIRGLGSAAGLTLAPILMRRIDVRFQLALGLVAILVALNGMTLLTLQASLWLICWTGMLHGFGLGLMVMPLTVVGFATLPPELRDQASSIFNLVRNLGGSIGVAAVSFILLRSTDANLLGLYEHFAAFGPNAPDVLLTPWPLDNAEGLFLIKMELIRQSRMVAYHNVFLFLIWSCALIIPMLFLMRKPVDHPALSRV